MAAYDARNLHLIDLVDAELTVYLQPGYCTSVSEGVHEELDNSLLRYVDDQEAVLLAYRNVRVVSKQALLTSWLPYLTIDARADLVLFKPIPGKVLVGRVHKLTDGMLGLLVLGGINASITAEQMPDGFAYDKKHICWVPNGDHSKAILMGDYVACRVLSTPVTDPDEEELLFNLDATLRDPEAGLCAQQTQLQQQKRSHIAAAAAAAKKQQQADDTPKSAHKASKKKHKDKKEHKKERRKDKEHKSASKDKKRKRDEGDQQPDGKQKKQKQQQPSEHHTQQQQQQQPSNGLPPVDVSGNEPVTPAAPGSKKDKQHRGKGSSHKSASSSHKKHGSSSHKKHGSSSHKKHKDKQQDKDSSKKDRGEGKKSSKKDKRKDDA